ncbi:DUF3021 family protein [Streptococcus zalophi]|uniref:DUF3021 family protein n=1 Tax=Streptococcus zalophi TaxID=640031 RepID=UPI0028526C46|nr:DUF3021 family protein [Streptococcus zalophi]
MLITNAIIRGIIPFIIMTTISIIMKYQGIDSFQVKSTFLVGIIVTTVAGASVIYDIENWSLLKQSLVHFVVHVSNRFPLFTYQWLV